MHLSRVDHKILASEGQHLAAILEHFSPIAVDIFQIELLPGDVESSEGMGAWTMLLHQISALRKLDGDKHAGLRQKAVHNITQFKPANVPVTDQ